ncbi:MAG: hypothetical protein JWO38_5138 [Gemmataceae bacterium]|nr:hypothetical protein [Gemmataceae bacterium]
MLRPGIVSGFVCFVLVAPATSDEPKKSDNKADPVTKDKLLGKWEGPKDVPITLEFTEKKLTVTVVATAGGMPKSTTLKWDYAIDAKENLVNLQPLDHGGALGNAWLKADGTLSVLIVPVPPAIPKALKYVTFTFVKPKDPKK